MLIVFKNQQIPTSKAYWNLIYESFNKNDLKIPTDERSTLEPKSNGYKDPVVRNLN